MFTPNTMTAFILLGTGYVGYTYARLQHDEPLKRHMHCYYSNFMWLFETFAAWYDDRYEHYKNAFLAIDTSRAMWEKRRNFIAEVWIKHKL